MTDQELQDMIRASIARHIGPRTAPRDDERPPVGAHASHILLPLARGGDGEGPCLIEPAVRCNHCGYCLSYGH